MQARPKVISTPQEMDEFREKMFASAIARAKVLAGVFLVLFVTEVIVFAVGTVFLIQSRRYGMISGYSLRGAVVNALENLKNDGGQVVAKVSEKTLDMHFGPKGKSARTKGLWDYVGNEISVPLISNSPWWA